MVDGGVGGNGYVQALSAKGSTFAGGTSTFAYQGVTNGNGNAMIKTKIGDGSAFVMGSAFANGN